MDKISDLIQNKFNISDFLADISAVLVMLFLYAILFTLCYFGWKFFQKMNRRVFKKINEKRGRSMTVEFLEHITAFLITMFFVILPFNWDSLRQSIFGSAAVLTAIIGFAAQDVIKDILAGLQISIYKPFDIGDRIEMDNGTTGIVENITMRHVVLKRIDTLRVVVPNSKMNEYSVVNYSYDEIPRSILFRFPISYRSNIRQAKQVIGQVIKDSPYTIPGKRTADGKVEYAPVYFIELDDSSLIMSVTVYYNHNIPTETVKDDINTTVFEALAANGIEIPYNYTNVVIQKG